MALSDIDSNDKFHHRKDDNNIDEIHDRLTEDEMRLMTRSAIRKQIEIEIYIPCAARISELSTTTPRWCLDCSYDQSYVSDLMLLLPVASVLQTSFAASEATMQRKIKALLTFDQQFFGISPEHVK